MPKLRQKYLLRALIMVYLGMLEWSHKFKNIEETATLFFQSPENWGKDYLTPVAPEQKNVQK